jgi:2-desacetyl-2-hydroxyethyl bacteriochlorophyllide A dehydrogenase
VAAAISLISTGTELTVLRKAFDPGTHWDRFTKYPAHPGYCFVGRVIEAAADVTSPRVGDRVSLVKQHASEHVVDASSCIPIPDGLPDELAAWSTLAKVAAMGAQAASHGLGDSVLVIGAGPIGQMSVRWAVAAGVERVVSLDTIPLRLTHAQAGGATATVARPAGEARDEVLAACDGVLPAIVIDSTGNPAVLGDALALTADHGRLVLVGDPGSPASQRLTPDIIIRGITMTGVHGMHRLQGWDFARVARLFHRLVLDGRFRMNASLITHRFRPEQCPEAYRVAEREKATAMGIIYSWA